MKKHLFLLMATVAILLASCGRDHQSQSAKEAGSQKLGPKNVLILSSSPRKGGNSDLLCDQFMAGARQAGHQVEKVFLHDLNIQFLRTNDDYEDRSLRTSADDAIAVVDKMIGADVIVMATPIYYYNMSGQIKVMIDRIFEREEELTHKDFYFIMTSGDPDKNAMNCAIDGFRNFLRSTPSSKEKGVIYGTGVSSKGEIKDKPIMKEAYRMGQKL